MTNIPTKVIKGGSVSVQQYLQSVWDARHLMMSFAIRDLKVQYAHTYLGILWSVIQPLTGLAIFTLFFQKLIQLPVEVPYAAFAFTGIMGWFYFTGLVGQAGTSLMHNQQIIRKIHFPRLVLPLSKAITGLTELGISMILLIGILIVSGVPLSWKIIFVPFVVLLNMLVGLSVGIWLSALTIRFRDLHHIIPYLIGFGIWLTPVFYPTTIVPARFDWIYYMHPVAGVISLYRWIFLGGTLQAFPLVTAMILALALLLSGLWFFIYNEKHIAEQL